MTSLVAQTVKRLPTSKTAGRNMNNVRLVDDTTLMAESEEELKSLHESERE